MKFNGNTQVSHIYIIMEPPVAKRRTFCIKQANQQQQSVNMQTYETYLNWKLGLIDHKQGRRTRNRCRKRTTTTKKKKKKEIKKNVI